MPEIDRRYERAALAGVPGLSRRIRLTLAGMVAERVAACFWPAWSALLATLVVWKLAPLGGIEIANLAWTIPALLCAALAVTGLARFQIPSRSEAVARMDSHTPQRPLEMLGDRQASGLDDAGSRQLWLLHQERTAIAAGTARPVPPDMRLASRDCWSLRYIAATAFVIAFLFAPDVQMVVSSDTSANETAGIVDAVPVGAFDAWIEPPTYTGASAIYLNETAGDAPLPVPAGSRLSVRTYGNPEDYSISASVSRTAGAAEDLPEWTIDQDGWFELEAVGGELFRREFIAVPDEPPTVALTSGIQTGPFGRTFIGFTLEDDYGIADAQLDVRLDPKMVERSYGLELDPEGELSRQYGMPLPYGRQGRKIETEFSGDFSDHPWAGLPVELVAMASDSAGQTASLAFPVSAMPGRVFFNPAATSVVEQRRDLLWNRENSDRVSRVLRAISQDPSEDFENYSAYLTTKISINLLEAERGEILKDDVRDAVENLLWNTAIELEEGDLGNSRMRLAEAAQRLADAIDRGASREEIMRLEEEYRRALEQFMAELAKMAQQAGEQAGQDEQSFAEFGEMREIDQSMLQRMMEQLARLLAEGRTAEAGLLLEQLRRLTENMVASRRSGPGSGGGLQQSMQGFGGTLQRQQGLADEAFRMLQEGQGEGSIGSGQPTAREQGQGMSADGELGPGQGSGVAERQEALRQELRQQMRRLADQGLNNRDAYRDFEQAARAMTRARDQLNRNEFEGALLEQSEALEALGRGIRSLGREQDERTGASYGGPPGSGEVATDPLGRRRGGRFAGVGSLLVPDELVRRRSQELRQEIRRRVGEPERTEFERDYLKRLLDLY